MIIPPDSYLAKKLPQGICSGCGQVRTYPGQYCGHCGRRFEEERCNAKRQQRNSQKVRG